MSKPFNVTLIQPQGYIFSAALKEAAEYLCAMLQQCGFDAQLSTNELRPGAYNVILCAHLLGASDLPRIPRDSIVFNSEPLGKGDHWHFASDTYSRILARFHVWDYAERNLARIDHARKDTIPFWYCRQLVRTRSPARRLRSLLFYGAPTVAARIGAPGITGPMISQACATGVARSLNGSSKLPLKCADSADFRRVAVAGLRGE